VRPGDSATSSTAVGECLYRPGGDRDEVAPQPHPITPAGSTADRRGPNLENSPGSIATPRRTTSMVQSWLALFVLLGTGCSITVVERPAASFASSGYEAQAPRRRPVVSRVSESPASASPADALPPVAPMPRTPPTERPVAHPEMATTRPTNSAGQSSPSKGPSRASRSDLVPVRPTSAGQDNQPLWLVYRDVEDPAPRSEQTRRSRRTAPTLPVAHSPNAAIK